MLNNVCERCVGVEHPADLVKRSVLQGAFKRFIQPGWHQGKIGRSIGHPRTDHCKSAGVSAETQAALVSSSSSTPASGLLAEGAASKQQQQPRWSGCRPRSQTPLCSYQGCRACSTRAKQTGLAAQCSSPALAQQDWAGTWPCSRSGCRPHTGVRRTAVTCSGTCRCVIRAPAQVSYCMQQCSAPAPAASCADRCAHACACAAACRWLDSC